MEIGDRIKAARKAAGLTQVELAKRLSVDKSAVAQWEAPNVRGGISVPNLINVARILSVPVTALTGEDAPSVLEVRKKDEITLITLFRAHETEMRDQILKLLFVSAAREGHAVESPDDRPHPAKVTTLTRSKQRT